MVLSGLLSVALAKPSEIVPAVVGNLISEKSIESHGNSVVHSVAAPVVAPVIAPATIPLIKTIEPVLPVAKAAAIVAEKTIESHGHSIVHHSAPSPAPALSYLTQAAPVASAGPFAVTEIKNFSEKSEKAQDTFEKLESSEENKRIYEKLENVGRRAMIDADVSTLSTTTPAGTTSPSVQASERTESFSKTKQEESVESRERNESDKSRQLAEKSDSYEGQLILQQRTTPAPVSYLTAIPLVPAVTSVAQSVIAQTSKAENVVDKSESLPTKQFTEKLEALDNGAVLQEAVPLLHTTLHAAPFAYAASAPAARLYYYPISAAVLAEKSISSYGHSIVHAA